MMKKILITSDTHRRDGNLLEVIQNEAPFDMFIHLGDAEGSEDMITSWFREIHRKKFLVLPLIVRMHELLYFSAALYWQPDF